MIVLGDIAPGQIDPGLGHFGLSLNRMEIMPLEAAFHGAKISVRDDEGFQGDISLPSLLLHLESSRRSQRQA